MKNRLYVGNLAFEATETVIEKRFSECGAVTSVALVLDQVSRRSRGFAFVEMASAEDAQRALAELNGKDLLGRYLRVDVAEERRNGPMSGGRERSGSGGAGRWRAGR
jgi:RNA recognition motif-containing protein